MSANFKMNRFVRKLFGIVAFILVGAEHLCAFSLLGPRPPWQTDRLGYSGPFGPMHIHEEYRWNVPILYYGYSPEFLTYFGTKGVEAIEEAVAILNALPALEDVDLDDYQLESGRFNLRASALGLTDMKSVALTMMLQGRGLADPTEFVYTLRNKWVLGSFPPAYYHVIKRNFDPVTLRSSSFVNGTLWTYTILEYLPGEDLSLAYNYPVDPLERLQPRTAPVTSSFFLGNGFFWTQLTRDDVGGLKHIYRASNFNPENSIPGVSITGNAAVIDPNTGQQQVGIFPGGTDFTDFPGVIIDPGESPTDFPIISTNTPPVGPQPPTPDGQVAAPAATRGGMDHIEMVRTDYDALLGLHFEPLTLLYTEMVLTNNGIAPRTVTRTVIEPDILFEARDLQGGDATAGIAPYGIVVRSVGGEGDGAWLSSDSLDGISGDDFGPGVIVPSYEIVFNTVGEIYYNQWPFLMEGDFSTQSLLTWGFFDGSTNDPIVFPVGTSVLELEQQVGQ